MRLIFFFGVLFGAFAFGQTGTVTGEVVFPKDVQGKRLAVEKYTGKISGKVAKPPAPRVGVWLTQPGVKAPQNPEKGEIIQKNYQFGTSLLVVPKGSQVSFPNEDVDYHNIYSLSRTKRFDLGRYRKGEDPEPVLFNKAGFVDLRCEIHKHMQAKILVVDTPYYATTDANGKFTIPVGVPAGTYTIHAQIDKKRKVSHTVTVVAGKKNGFRLSLL